MLPALLFHPDFSSILDSVITCRRFISPAGASSLQAISVVSIEATRDALDPARRP
jgi:hypothetical protein